MSLTCLSGDSSHSTFHFHVLYKAFLQQNPVRTARRAVKRTERSASRIHGLIAAASHNLEWVSQATVTPSPPNSEPPTMASLFLRSLARSTSAPASRLLCRNLSTTIRRHADPTVESQKNLLDYHTVEDLQGMSVAEVLQEAGTEKERRMRHFTGGWSWCSVSYFR